MKVSKQLIAFIVLALLLGACAQSESLDRGAPAAAEAPVEEVSEESFAAQDSTTNQTVQEQLIIRTGNIEIIVEDTEVAIDEIAGRAAAVGGWVVSSNVVRSGEAKSGSMTIRVPVEQFEDVMAQIENMAVEVVSSSTSGEDVTEEYVDRQARLENLEATAERVRGFLEDADNVEDALAVNAELSRLEGDIEALRGRIQYLEQSAAFSTITVHVTPDALAQPIEIGGWRFTGVVRDAASALISALQGLATIAIWIVVVLLPLALIILLPLAVIFMLVRRWRRRSPGQEIAAE
ncbi:MAG TPA: DUF4349 domain-containing protein [Candidatus Binatia bacterium]|jgi:hypothetical protein|nr:DUF4349 domain-containing protein [Candidatus Binatia bacterium]